jgi:hypothetical protein
MCSQNIKRWLGICISYLIYSQIWLTITSDDCHFGYNKNSLKKHWTSDFGFASPNKPESWANYSNTNTYWFAPGGIRICSFFSPWRFFSTIRDLRLITVAAAAAEHFWHDPENFNLVYDQVHQDLKTLLSISL